MSSLSILVNTPCVTTWAKCSHLNLLVVGTEAGYCVCVCDTGLRYFSNVKPRPVPTWQKGPKEGKSEPVFCLSIFWSAANTIRCYSMLQHACRRTLPANSLALHWGMGRRRERRRSILSEEENSGKCKRKNVVQVTGQDCISSERLVCADAWHWHNYTLYNFFLIEVICTGITRLTIKTYHKKRV